jgi:hypothetical protein
MVVPTAVSVVEQYQNGSAAMRDADAHGAGGTPLSSRRAQRQRLEVECSRLKVGNQNAATNRRSLT